MWLKIDRLLFISGSAARIPKFSARPNPLPAELLLRGPGGAVEVREDDLESGPEEDSADSSLQKTSSSLSSSPAVDGGDWEKRVRNRSADNCRRWREEGTFASMGGKEGERSVSGADLGVRGGGVVRGRSFILGF